MSPVTEAMRPYVDSGAVPGLVALVAHGDQVETVVLGSTAVHGAAMTSDAVFRLASSSKPITAAATLLLVQDGVIGLDEPVAELLPELADPVVLRDPSGALDDTVPADRPITVRDLLGLTAGQGFPSHFAHPSADRMLADLGQGPPRPQHGNPPEEWMRILGSLPLLHQPGAGWTYNTGADVLGVLIARAGGHPFADFLRERLFLPLGMTDTAFTTRPDQTGRITSLYRRDPDDGLLTEVDGPAGQWSSPPVFPSGAGGLVSTAADWFAFATMLLAGGVTVHGERILDHPLLTEMMTDHTTVEQRAFGSAFLDGQGWGYGGSVDIDPTEPWQTLGRYGWVGGLGTVTYLTPSTGDVAILLTQVELGDATSARMIDDFLTAAHAG